MSQSFLEPFKSSARALFHERRAISATIASLILVGAVIAPALAWTIWIQYSSSIGKNEGEEQIDTSIKTLGERLAFMYTFYESSKQNLTVDLMNCGTVDEITLQTVYIADSSGHTLKTFPSITLVNFNGNPIMGQKLNKGEQGRFILTSLGNVAASTSYCTLIVATGRGTPFVIKQFCLPR